MAISTILFFSKKKAAKFALFFKGCQKKTRDLLRTFSLFFSKKKPNCCAQNPNFICPVKKKDEARSTQRVRRISMVFREWQSNITKRVHVLAKHISEWAKTEFVDPCTKTRATAPGKPCSFGLEPNGNIMVKFQWLKEDHEVKDKQQYPKLADLYLASDENSSLPMTSYVEPLRTLGENKLEMQQYAKRVIPALSWLALRGAPTKRIGCWSRACFGQDGNEADFDVFDMLELYFAEDYTTTRLCCFLLCNDEPKKVDQLVNEVRNLAFFDIFTISQKVRQSKTLFSKRDRLLAPFKKRKT